MFPPKDWHKQLLGPLYNLGVWLVINYHFSSLPKATRQRIDNYTTVIYVGNNGNNHLEFPKHRKRSYWKHTLIRGLSALAWEEISFDQLVENALQKILLVIDKEDRISISSEPRTEVPRWITAFFLFIIWIPTCIVSWSLSCVFISCFLAFKSSIFLKSSYMKLAAEVCAQRLFIFLCLLFNCLVTLALPCMLLTVNSTLSWSLCFCFNKLMSVCVTGHWT